MPSTYLSLHYHVVFSTKDRDPTISNSWMTDLHKYISGTVDGLGGFSQGIGGVNDHVHLLFGLKATHCLADFMRDLKRSSSLWVHEKCKDQNFSWQDGYAAFTVSSTARDVVNNYIKNQAEHHKQRTFREELIDMLQRADIDFDMRYLD